MYGLDLFSGIGGITKALEGYVEPVVYCENERHAQAVLLSKMRTGDIPTAPIWDDVRTLRGSYFSRPLGIIYGGFPCQDISIAGRGAGLGGERSGLFYEIARLVGEIRPRFVFLENVPAITSRGGWDVIGAFAALGYDCRWDMLSAYDVGAPHLRERWFLLAHAGQSNVNTRRNGGMDGEKTEWSLSTKEPQRRGQNVADAESKQTGRIFKREVPPDTGPGRQGPGETSWWSVEPNVGRVAHGIPSRVDRLRGLGNAVVPAQAREAFERLMGLKP